MMDFRGRIYPRVTYLHYQGSEFAKSLLLFSKPGYIKRTDLKSILYLKAYGALLYGNGLDKKSYIIRGQWVDSNIEAILSLDYNLIRNASNKYLFISFCLEFKKFHNFYYNGHDSTFQTYLPIQLDATCNGFQHLALLSDDVNAFEELNLTEATINDDPKDLYTFILNKIRVNLNDKLYKTSDINELECIKRLIQLDINRSHIKHLVMTKPYNASDFTLTNYLIDKLIYRGYGELVIQDGKNVLKLKSHENKDMTQDSKLTGLPEEYEELAKFISDIKPKTVMDKKAAKLLYNKSSYKKYYSTSLESNAFVSIDDINYLVEEFNNMLYIAYPNIKMLIDYLSDIANIMSKYNLPVI